MVSLAAKLFRPLYGNKNEIIFFLKNYILKLEMWDFEAT